MTHLPVAFSVAFLLEAALRALVAGVAVWAVLRLFRIRNVVAEKAVWCLLLAAALLLPFAPAQMGLSAADVAGRIYALPQNAWASCFEKLAPHKATTAAAPRPHAGGAIAARRAVRSQIRRDPLRGLRSLAGDQSAGGGLNGPVVASVLNCKFQILV